VPLCKVRRVEVSAICGGTSGQGERSASGVEAKELSYAATVGTSPWSCAQRAASVRFETSSLR
jgi:hypothetical protein